MLKIELEPYVELAACAGDSNPDLWHANERTPRKMVARALAICRSCPVRQTCLETNLHEPFGIWGGLTERQRAELRHGARPIVERAQ